MRHERHDSKGIWEIVEPVRGEIRATDAYYHVVLERIFPCSEPAFHEPEMQERVWGRRWGVVNDVGTMKLVALHRRP